MKKLKFLSLLVLAFTATTLTSCFNDDDDDYGLNAAQIAQCFNATHGTHSGYLIYQGLDEKGKLKSKVDSVSARWSINTDSTMTFNYVPSSVLATAIADSTIRKAVAQEDPVNMKGYIGFVDDNPIQWLINPMTVTYNVTYGGAQHTVQLVFAMNSNWSYGVLVPSTTKQQMQIIVAAMYVDKKFVSDGIINTSLTGVSRTKPFVFREE